MPRHITWETLSKMISEGRPFRRGIAGTPLLEWMVEDKGCRLGLLVPYPASAGVPHLDFQYVSVVQRRIDDTDWLYLSTSCVRLFQEFHGFLTGVADSIQIEHRAPLSAINERLRAWDRLFARVTKLTVEEELGLIGELWLLHAAIRHRGTRALAAWTGPLGEPHDFRFGNIDLEVKTTRSVKRVHVINSLAQLLPSPGRTLTLLSLQFQPAGAAEGYSLPGLVDQIEALVQLDPPACCTFLGILADHFGYTKEQSHYYPGLYSFRSHPRLIPVDQHCPKLIRSWIESGAGADIAGRILNVSYEIDVEGLGFEDGTEQFSKRYSALMQE